VAYSICNEFLKQQDASAGLLFENKENLPMASSDTVLKNEILEGPIPQVLAKLFLPMFIGQILLVVYGLTDSLFVSLIDRSSTSLVTGIGLVFPIFFFFNSIGFGLSGGISSLVARALGEKNLSSVEKIGDSGLFFACILGLISVIMFYVFGSSLINFLAGSQMSAETISNGLSFFYFIIPGLFFLLLFQVLTGIFQGEGLMKYTAMAMMITVLSNIALDPVFIFAFKLGVGGAGLATTFAILIGFLYLLILFIKGRSVIRIKFHFSSVSLRQITQIIKIGFPNASNMILLSIAFMAINYCVTSIGEDVMNAWTLVGRMDEFILIIGYALSGATLTLAGQNYGQNAMKRVKQSFRIASIYGVAGSILLALIYNIFAQKLFGLLTGNPSVLEHCIYQVRIISFSYVGIVVAIVLNGLFIGTGKAGQGVAFTFIRVYLVLLPVILIATFYYKSGINVLIYIFVMINIATLFMSVIWGEVFLKNLKYVRLDEL
jgi:putative MATE family efflux protein